MRASLLVNGSPSELLVEEDALTWWRPNEGQRLEQSESPMHQLVRHLSSSSLNRVQQHDNSNTNGPQRSSPATIVTTPSLGSAAQPTFSRKQERVEFGQIVGVVRVPRKSERRRHGGQVRSELASSTSSTHSAAPTGDDKQRDAQQCAPSDKLKVFFAKKSGKKGTSRLLKLKKITFEASRDRLAGHSRLEAADITTRTGQRNQQTETLLADLHDLIAQHLELKRRQRPKRLLIFVNPFGGKGKAVYLFERKVRRVLELAGIESELIVTQYANHARDTLEEPSFQVDRFDGIICVGGDGMFAELMNGLLYRLNREKLLGSAPASSVEGQTVRSESSLDLDSDSVTGSSAAPGSTAASSPATLSEHLREASDTRTSVIPSDEDKNNNTSHYEGACGLVGQKSADSTVGGGNQAAQSFAQQMKFLRSSLGGIGERFHTPPIPIGVIGAGSTDANLFGFIGTNDVISATLNIVLGNQIQIDVCSIHSIRDDRLLRFVSTFVAYGYFGDVVRESERLRWLGPSRYDVTGLNSLIKYRAYDGLVRILSSPRDGSPRDLNRCHLGCRLCQNSISNSLSFNDFSHLSESRAEHVERTGKCRDKQALAKALDDLDHFEIVEKRGPFIGVNAAVTACRCPKTRKGFSPGNHLANGCADLILVRPCSRLQYINYLLRTGYTNKSAFDLKYVEAHRCRQFEFIVEGRPGPSEDCSRASSNDEHSGTSGYGSSSTIKQSSGGSLGDSAASLRGTRGAGMGLEREHGDQARFANSSWNADGEILAEQSIRVKVNNKLLRVFGTGEPR